MGLKNNDIIGGEFEFRIPTTHGNVSSLAKKIFSEGTIYASGRAALYQILIYARNLLKKSVVYLPDYLCESVIEAARLTKLDIRFYHVTPELSADFSALSKKELDNAVVLLINYFGGTDNESSISELRKISESVCVVEDNVQAFFDMLSHDSNADFVFTSFRKSLPVPDGGWVKTSFKGMPKPETDNNFSSYKIAGGILKGERLSEYFADEIYLELLNRGERLIENNYESWCSRFTLDTLGSMDFVVMSNCRQRNAKYVIDGLSEIGISPILSFKPNAVPLFVPVRLPDRDKIRRALFADNIFCPVHWPLSYDIEKLERGCELSQTELSLIVDHRYGLEDMERMMKIIKRHLS